MPPPSPQTSTVTLCLPSGQPDANRFQTWSLKTGQGVQRAAGGSRDLPPVPELAQVLAARRSHPAVSQLRRSAAGGRRPYGLW